MCDYVFLILNKKVLRMKKIMLLLAAGLFFLPSCSKEASEPVPSVQKGDEGEGTFNFSMEGVREDVFDNEGRALQFNPKVQFSGNKVTGVSPSTQKGKVKGVAYFYNPNTGAYIVKMLDFEVDGKRISYKGTIDNPQRIPSGTTLRAAGFTKVSLYVGGSISTSQEEGEREGAFTYNVGLNNRGQGTRIARTVDGLDLSRFNPIFVSEENDVQINPKETNGFDGAMTGKVRFRLFGEFVNVRFQNSAVGKNLRFSGVIVAGFSVTGLTLERPKYWRNKSNSPKLMYGTLSSDAFNRETPGGIYFPFPDGKVYTLNGPSRGQAPTKIPGDPCYTLYLNSEAEKEGGIRFGYLNSRTNVFTSSGHTMKQNVTNLMGRTSSTKNFGKFHNLLLNLQ